MTGIVQLSSIGGKVAHGNRIGQFKTVEFTVEAEGVSDFNTFVQVDGEAFRCPPTKISIKAQETQVSMLNRTKTLVKQTEKVFGGRKGSFQVSVEKKQRESRLSVATVHAAEMAQVAIVAEVKAEEAAT